MAQNRHKKQAVEEVLQPRTKRAITLPERFRLVTESKPSRSAAKKAPNLSSSSESPAPKPKRSESPAPKPKRSYVKKASKTASSTESVLPQIEHKASSATASSSTDMTRKRVGFTTPVRKKPPAKKPIYADENSDLEEETPPKKIKVDPEAALWHPGGNGSYNPTAMYNRRKAKKSGVKTSVLFDFSVIGDKTPGTQHRFEKTIAEKVSKIKGHRPPIARSEESKADVADAIFTPEQRTKLPKTRSYGGLHIFGGPQPKSSPSKPLLTTMTDEKKEIIQFAAPFQAITVYESKDPISVVITKKMLAAAKKEKRDNAGRRKGPSQAQAVKAPGAKIKDVSATQYGQLFIPTMVFEFLHFVAYMIQGSLSQKAENLGCGSFDANTDMMFVEELHPTLAKAYGKYNLDVKPTMVEGTRLMSKLDYTITTKDFTLKFEFNCQMDVTPDLINRDYIKAFVETCIEMGKGKLKQFDSPVAYNYFYNRPPQPPKAAANDENTETKKTPNISLASPKK